MDKYITTIGLEVHMQLNTKSKMFCGCSNKADDNKPNSVVCPVCFGMPGTLPVANKEAIRKTLLLGKALGSTLADEWNFERKNYFYPDLPKGYQITSSTKPPVIGGVLAVADGDEGFKVRIHHVHLEEDAGKLMHGSDGYSLVDLNRAGTPLMELVTEPDIHTPRCAKLFLQEMQKLIRAIGVSEANMEMGHMRCDVNVSIAKEGASLGKKVEIKNLNSFSSVERALEFEVKRQTEMIESGEKIEQETRGWDDAKGKTLGQRSKEDSQDYRYMPEPDLPPFVRSEVPEFSDGALKGALPELPQDKITRLKSDYGLSDSQAGSCISDVDFGVLVEAVLKSVGNKESAKGLLFGDLLRISKEKSLSFNELKITTSDLVELISLKESGAISQQIVKTNLEALMLGKISIDDLKKHGEASSAVDVDAIVKEVIAVNPKAVEQFKAGDAKVLGFLVGQVMAKSKGAANPQIVNEKLKEVLK